MLEIPAEVFQFITPLSLACLIFAAGMFYKKVQALGNEIIRLEGHTSVKLNNIKGELNNHAQQERKTEQELTKIATALEYIKEEHQEFRAEIRRLLEKTHTTFPPK